MLAGIADGRIAMRAIAALVDLRPLFRIRLTAVDVPINDRGASGDCGFVPITVSHDLRRPTSSRSTKILIVC